jgi:hypothetical protein
MALLWIEGFEGFGSSIGAAPSPTGIIGRKYPTIVGESVMDIEVGRYGDYCLQIGDYTDHLQTPHLTTDSTLIFGGALKLPSIPVSTRFDLFFFFSSVTEGMQVRIETDGTLSVYNGNTLLSTSLQQMTVDTWHYLEFKVVTHDSAGSYELRVDGSTWTSGTGVDTQPAALAYHTAVRLTTPFAVQASWDDIYILDGTGSMNDFLGNRAVMAIRPDGAGDDSDWTPSAGSNYQNVDEVELDEDTTHNETSTSTDQDLFTYDDVSGVSSIDGVMVNTETRVTTGSMELQVVCKSGTTTDIESAGTITSQTYISKQRILEEDPDASAVWTPTTLNAAQFGVKAI